MENFFKSGGLMALSLGMAISVSAQTHYGTGAGTLGPEHAFFGTDAGKANGTNGTVGGFNTYIGHFAGKNAYGQCNTFIGNSAGLQTTTGQSNTFVGFQTGQNNGEYVQGTFVGARAGKLSTGDQNSFFGDQAGSESSGSNNVFLGFRTGNYNNNGSDNSFLGAKAGYLSKNSRNVFIGTEAGYNNQQNENVYIGWKSGYMSTSGFANTYIGTKSGFNAKGMANTIIGHQAGSNLEKLDFSTFVGAGAGATATGYGNGYYGSSTGVESVGDYNLFLGWETGALNKGSGNIMLGTKAGYYNNGSDNTFIGKESGYLNTTGIGNAFIGETSGRNNDSGLGNAFLGNKTGYSNKSGSLNTFLGYGAGYSNTTGEKNTYLGYGSGGKADIINATAIGASAKVTASNCLVLGSNANVGIGVSAPVYQLQLSAETAAKPGSSSWAVMSDQRLKRNISEFTEGLDVLKQIKPVWFQYNGKAGIETGDKKFVGIIAQEMQKIAPYTIGTFTHQDSLGNKTDYLDYDANAVTYILINSVKEQQRIIEDKEAQIQNLESRLEKLERLMSATPGVFNSAGKEAGSLEQNVPNGFSNKTSIKYFIPQSVKTAVIDIYTVAGVKVSSHPISERGAGELVISADKYRSGVHVYDLVMDGKSLGAKKMVVE
ncbi:hypothetical protein J2Y45_001327 [Dyadobacter sp. BE34]|uniref:Peptidase S74 domain-containing protein n=1 Tax=Dyadobacter fermentans TaxID=94254 RepID=A0ABU1QSA7_9BACT|nr:MULTISPECIES: tail fiber domain-containing protein [Dyadobacter]MDR6804058.1 hypothetical protein [Dyadobacter fermentans]MDR7041798.1 hypothetical protein [Dyadobacter sp. BE242]MDR7196201.1 hypothetical protein [Dyadobacter sp. BE34]MDR7213254.1 hypothetical protein [Dyadobacter sp. BE31]MDR7261607.1 hypothetical protein [Dyadobacter sp. BE32]